MGPDDRGQPDRGLRTGPRGDQVHDPAAVREDHQHRVAVLVLGRPPVPAYAATKHGIAGFTKAYCDELAQHNIQVNALAPGYFATKITEATRSDPETNQRVVDHIPAGRWGDPSDLMGALVFLSCRASDYVNGHTLVVDGGYLVR